MFAARNMLFARAAVGGSAYETEIDVWIAAIIAQGDTVSSNNAAAWNAVVAGAKTAGYWSEIKSIVPFAGPAIGGTRAPVPILGPTPTIVGTFASGDRTTNVGFISNGSAYLDSGIAQNSTTWFGSDPTDEFYFGIYVSRSAAFTSAKGYMGGSVVTGFKAIEKQSSTNVRGYPGSASINVTTTTATFRGVLSVRRSVNSVTIRADSATTTATLAAANTPPSTNLFDFRYGSGGTSIDSGTGIGARFTGTSGVDESHFRGLLDTCFAALT